MRTKMTVSLQRNAKNLHDDSREPETQQNARPFGSSMAERQHFGCLNTWPCNCKQKPSLRSPITLALL